MNETFKYSTLFAKVVIVCLIMAAAMLSSVKTFAKTANEELVFQSVRLSLWYEGTDKSLQKDEGTQANAMQMVYPEELFRAMQKHHEQKSTALGQ